MTKNALRASFVALISVSALIGAGCSSEPEATSTPTPEATPATAATTAPTETATTENPTSTSDSNKMGPPSPAEANAPTTGPTPFKSSGKTVKDPSGLEYDDMTVGTGPAPKQGQFVKVHYIGTLTDGTEFDASYKRNQPFEFQLGAGQVIPGWDKCVATMKVGGRRKVTIPSDLAYGPSGRPPVIPPAATLVFDIELLGVSDTPTVGPGM